MNIIYSENPCRCAIISRAHKDTIFAVYAPSFRSTRARRRVCSNAVNKRFLRRTPIARYIYSLSCPLEAEPTMVLEMAGEILDENLLTVDELKPLEGFAFQFLVCRPLRSRPRTYSCPSCNFVPSEDLAQAIEEETVLLVVFISGGPLMHLPRLI